MSSHAIRQKALICVLTVLGNWFDIIEKMSSFFVIRWQ